MRTKYPGAWILGQLGWVQYVGQIDGFAAPGRHTDGEPGSPLLRMDALVEHRSRERLDVDPHFFFIEKDPRRIESRR